MVREYPMLPIKNCSVEDFASRDMRMAFPHGRRTKQAGNRSIRGKIKITKASLNKQDTTVRKHRAVCKPPYRDLGLIPRSRASQMSTLSQEEFRVVSVDSSLGRNHPRSASTTDQFACINGDPLYCPRGTASSCFTARECWQSPPLQAQYSDAFRTRTGRVSRPPIRWGT